MAFNFSTRGSASPTAFEQQREELVREIAVVSSPLIPNPPNPGWKRMKNNRMIKGMEEVLQNINQLNRNLESAIAVCHVKYSLVGAGLT